VGGLLRRVATCLPILQGCQVSRESRHPLNRCSRADAFSIYSILFQCISGLHDTGIHILLSLAYWQFHHETSSGLV
jgi:hypothetical protein